MNISRYTTVYTTTQTDRQTDIPIDRHTHRHIDTQMDTKCENNFTWSLRVLPDKDISRMLFRRGSREKSWN